jgi:hypothetical protein
MKMMELESMAVEMPEVEGHPNRAAFRGVLTVVDVASERAPSGSKGHRVVLTRAAAEAALPSLLGMALDYAPSFDRHDQRRKVGLITSAEVVGRNLEVGGYLYAKDFPEVVREVARSGRRTADFRSRTSDSGRRASDLKLPKLNVEGGGDSSRVSIPSRTQKARTGWVNGNEGPTLRESLAAAVGRLRELTAGITGRKVSQLRAGVDLGAGTGPGLGMSFEVADVILADKMARVWILTKVTFTGAAVLRRDKAAYAETWIELV